MSSAPVRPTARDPLDRNFLFALATATALLGFVAWEQSYWWRSIQDYRYGWLAPVFVAYAVSRRWAEIRAAAAACRTERSAVAGIFLRPLAPALVGGAFGGATLLFLFGALARAHAGPSHPTSLMIALGAGTMTLSLVFLSAPGGPDTPYSTLPPGTRSRLVGPFFYPAFVWLITAPLLSSLERPLSAALLGVISRFVLGVFHLLHLSVELQGNVFILRGQPVGLDEACLGLRSITGCVFGGWFLAEVGLRRRRLRVLLVAFALVMAVVTNFARVLFLNLYAYKYGASAIEGKVHDSAGWVVLGLSAIAVFALSTRLERYEVGAPSAPPVG